MWAILTWSGEYSRWRHQMETFSSLLALCAGNSKVTGEFPSQRPVTRSFDALFDLRLNKRLSTHYDVIVMSYQDLYCGGQCRYSAVSFLPNPHNRHTMATYGVSFVNTNFDVCSASVTEVLYAISCCIGPPYNGTQLYLVFGWTVSLQPECLMWNTRIDY